MLETLKSLDETIFLFLNAHHNLFFDRLMWLFSNRFFWVPLYAWFLWILYKKYPRHYWTVLVAILLMIVASDQFCNLIKNNVMRLRPSQEPHLEGLVHLVDGNGGLYGFYSAHASNAFAVAMFMIFSIGRKMKYIPPVSLAYAVLTAYSRVYMGVHYPGDILVGVIIGSLLGAIFATLHEKVRLRYFTKV